MPVTITLNGDVSCAAYSEEETSIVNAALGDHLPDATFSEDHECDDSADDDLRRLLAWPRRLETTATNDACTASPNSTDDNSPASPNAAIVLTVHVRHIVSGARYEEREVGPAVVVVSTQQAPPPSPRETESIRFSTR